MSTQRTVNWGLIAMIAIAVISWAVASLRSYAEDTATMKQRIAVVETKADDTAQWRIRMETKVDRALELLLEQGKKKR